MNAKLRHVNNARKPQDCFVGSLGTAMRWLRWSRRDDWNAFNVDTIPSSLCKEGDAKRKFPTGLIILCLPRQNLPQIIVL